MIKNFGVLRITAAYLLFAIAGWLGSSRPTSAEPLRKPLRIAQGFEFPDDSSFQRNHRERFYQDPELLPIYEPRLDNFSPPPSIEETTSKLYLVYIPGDNQRILERVRLVEPEAFRSNYRGRRVIQAGVFSIRSNAQRRARELERDGVRAAIATLEETRPEVSFRDNFDGEFIPPPFEDDDLLSDTFPSELPRNGSFDNQNAYVVVIPSSRPDLRRIAQLAVDAGISENEITVREEPIGLHVEIGPFPSSTIAQQESNLLRQFGLDARVYYRRSRPLIP
ncbi:MAG: hypothetical protein F6J93_21915 [Oscillatoria sp. SIO1A7]|nr:hypothetical protein [Oscillatoria sp. SIO1A7]